MTDSAPRDSAQLPPLPAKPPREDRPALNRIPYDVFTSAQLDAYATNYAREALRAQAASVEPVGEVGSMPGTSGFTMACFKAEDVPIGTKLYAGAPPAHIPAGALGAVKSLLDRIRPGVEAAPWVVEALQKILDTAPQPQAVAASSPATAVDAVAALQALYDAVDSCVELTPEVMQQARAALQASRPPQAQVPASWRAALQKFVDRVERGEIHSRQTYAEFKQLLKDSE